MRTISENIYPKTAKLALSQISDYEGTGKCSHVIISNGKVVQTCSSTYGHLQNEDFFTPFEEKMRSEGISFKANYKNVNDSYFLAATRRRRGGRGPARSTCTTFRATRPWP